MFVNLILAIELYLKALLLSKNQIGFGAMKKWGTLRIHEIKDLFNALEDREKKCNP